MREAICGFLLCFSFICIISCKSKNANAFPIEDSNTNGLSQGNATLSNAAQDELVWYPATTIDCKENTASAADACVKNTLDIFLRKHITAQDVVNAGATLAVQISYSIIIGTNGRIISTDVTSNYKKLDKEIGAFLMKAPRLIPASDQDKRSVNSTFFYVFTLEN